MSEENKPADEIKQDAKLNELIDSAIKIMREFRPNMTDDTAEDLRSALTAFAYILNKEREKHCKEHEEHGHHGPHGHHGHHGHHGGPGGGGHDGHGHHGHH